MQETINNVWLKRILSLISLIYVFVIGIFAYASFLYTLEFKPDTVLGFAIAYIIASAVFMVLMILTRSTMITRIIGIILPPLVFLLTIFNLGSWALIIPTFIVAVVVFFVSYNNATLKVILGTIYLLVYVLGLILVFVLNFLFGGSNTVETELNAETLSDPSNAAVYEIYKDTIDDINSINYVMDDNGNPVLDEKGNPKDKTISPDGTKKFYLADIQDNSTGNLVLYVIPNGSDKDFKFFTLKEKGVRYTVYRFGTRGAVPLEIAWEGNDTLKYQRRDGKIEESTIIMPEKNYFEFLGIN